MSWYDTDDFDYGYYRLVWGDLYPGQRSGPMRKKDLKRLRRSIRKTEAAYQRIFDDLAESARGMPPEDIAGPLARAFAEIGQVPDGDELTAYARRISDGGRIVIDLGLPQV